MRFYLPGRHLFAPLRRDPPERRWACAAVCAACLLGLASCNQTSVKGPVAKPPPPRISEGAPLSPATRDIAEVKPVVSEKPASAKGEWPPVMGVSANQPASAVVPAVAAAAREKKRGGAAQAGTSDGERDGEVASAIAAWVNGEVILTQEVLEPIRDKLRQARRQLSADDFTRFQVAEIQQQLRGLIERQIIVQEAKKKLPTRALLDWKKTAQADLDKQIKAQKKKYNVTTDAEFDEKLKEQGSSLARLRQMYEDNYIAQQFLRAELMPKTVVSRAELIEYYQEHQKEFEQRARAKWREIEVRYEKHPDREEAKRKAESIQTQLAAGADFAALARLESEGRSAPDGGLRDWTTKGSLIEEKLDQALFEMPVGEVSPIIEESAGLSIVKVEQREEAGAKSFESAQDEIRTRLREQKLQQAGKDYLERLLKNAEVETVFDAPRAGGGRPKPPTSPKTRVKGEPTSSAADE